MQPEVRRINTIKPDRHAPALRSHWANWNLIQFRSTRLSSIEQSSLLRTRKRFAAVGQSTNFVPERGFGTLVEPDGDVALRGFRLGREQRGSGALRVEPSDWYRAKPQALLGTWTLERQVLASSAKEIRSRLTW